MLRTFYGNDMVAVRGAAHQYVLTGIPWYVAGETSVTAVDADSYQPGIITEAVGGISLFGGTSVYILDTPSGDSAYLTEVTGQLEALAASAHEFIVIEGPLLAALKKPYVKYAQTIEEFSRTSDRSFNVFGMADALARKDRKSLWILLHDAFKAGLTSEEIIGTIWWQLKTLRLAAHTRTAAEAGMKDFSYNKAKRALGTFKEGEVAALSESLLRAYHDARLGKLELDLALERWVLTV